VFEPTRDALVDETACGEFRRAGFLRGLDQGLVEVRGAGEDASLRMDRAQS
jgi:hypothetical protein